MINERQRRLIKKVVLCEIAKSKNGINTRVLAKNVYTILKKKHVINLTQYHIWGVLSGLLRGKNKYYLKVRTPGNSIIV